MPTERFMRHHYGASGYVSPTGWENLRPDGTRHRGERMPDAYETMKAQKVAIEKRQQDRQAAEIERLTEALKVAIETKRKEQEENNHLRSLLESAQALDHFAWSAVTCDCPEATEYLQSLILNLRGALARIPERAA